MKFKKIKQQLWELINEEGIVIYGTSKRDCLSQLEKIKADEFKKARF